MPISVTHRCLFVHIPKTGGTSIEHALGMFRPWHIEDRQTLFGLIQSPDLLALGLKTGFLQHLSCNEIREILSAEYQDGLRTFSWIRNPWDRFLSLYSKRDPHMLQQASLLGLDLASLDFSSFIDAVEDFEHAHLQPQCHFITDELGKIKIDFLGRFERFSQDFSALTDMLGIDITIAHHNQSMHAQYRDVYSSADQLKVARRYAQDIDMFGYSF